MKKLLLVVLCLSAGLVSFGQNKEVQKQIKDVKFFGVDYSLAKVYGSDETLGQFIDAFARINGLFITESNKYNVAKYFKKKVTETLISQIQDINDNITDDSLFGGTASYKITDDMLENHIKSLPLSATDGTGLVFVTELMNKSYKQASYHIVFFDIASREILDSWNAIGKAKGFGLRNYWAGSIFNVLENVKIKN